LISVDLQEHVADPQGRVLVMGDDDLDLFHAGHYRGIPAVAAGLIACDCAADRVSLPGLVDQGLVRDGPRYPRDPDWARFA
jgi:hypothetical protein